MLWGARTGGGAPSGRCTPGRPGWCLVGESVLAYSCSRDYLYGVEL